MGERPLPDEVARAARAYLAALVSPSARADAWHDLLAEVRYWQDDQLVPVLRLAHQVVGQHERVTDEAAAHALVDVARLEVDDLAVVLGSSLDTARDLRERVEQARQSGERARVPSDDGSESGGRTDASGPQGSGPVRRPVPSATVDAQDVAADPQDIADPAPMTAGAPASPSLTEDATSRSSTHASTRAAAPALRIGFDDQDAVDVDRSDDDSDDGDDPDAKPAGGLLTYRGLVGIAVVVWVLVVVTWLLGDP